MSDKQDQKKKDGHRPEHRLARTEATHESKERRHEETGEPTTHLPHDTGITAEEADKDLQQNNIHSGK
jgi:hypothetical protein